MNEIENKELILNACARYDINAQSGKGIYLYDVDGTEYLDFSTGIATNSLGHSHPEIVKAIQEQAAKIIHTSNLYYNEEHMKMIKKLIDNCDLETVFLANSGTEANECALKLARKRGFEKDPEKYQVVYMDNSFHGRSFGSLSATGQEKYQKYYRPLVPGFVSATFNDIDDVCSKINDKTCAVIIEPVQGEGGLIPADIDFLKAVQKKCLEHDALLIFDEIQCGMGRIGTLFAYEAFGVVPDIVTLAKGLGAGICIGACVVGARGKNVYNPGDHGTTFGGNPLSSHVAYTVLTQLIDHSVVKNSKQMGDYLQNKLTELKNKYPKLIKRIAGMGLLAGIGFTEQVKNSDFVVKAIKEAKTLLVPAGDNVVRCLPPLNVTSSEIDLVIDRISNLLDTY